MAIKIGLITANYLLFFSICCICSSHAADTNSITQGQELADWQNLVSANGIFKLGFFSPGNSKNRYLGILYNNVADLTSVWVANRETPIVDSSGALTLDANGNLVITHGGGRYVLFNSNQTKTNLTATLLDSGNLVLAEVNSDGTTKPVLWQSFDYPSDTLLPGMKLGVNFKTGQKWSITSWTSDQVPAPGAFSLGANPNGTNQLFVWRRGQVYWTSGVWNDRNFENAPQLTSNNQFKFTSVLDDDQRYFSYSVMDNSTISRWVMDLWGQIQLYVLKDSSWNLLQFGSIGPCEGNTHFTTTGCVGNKKSGCRSSDQQFTKRKGDPYSGDLYDENSSLGLSDCDVKCRSNCSCFAYGSASDNGTGCRFWGRMPNFSGDSGSTDIYVLATNHVGVTKKWWIWFIVAVAAALLTFILGYFCCLCRNNLKSKGEQGRNQENLLLELGTNATPPHELRDVNKLEKDVNKDHDLQLFSFAIIAAATDDFSFANKLGEGGFGPVYKGKLPGGKEIAVKRLSRSSGQGLVEFKNEISLIAKLQHMNLVRLFGCCIQGKEKMLIYEYMPNKSLDSFIFDPNKRELLDWTKRFNIIEGIAQGLLYLHKYSRLKVIHRDLKASNILLDDEMNPKISDFGMARIFVQNEAEVNTTRVVGTYGYMSPEYAMNGIFSVKSDVFSFGVLLLEIISGRRNTSFHSDNHVNLIGYVWELWKEGSVLELMDPMLGDSCPKNKLLRCIHVGLLCVQESATDRPTMSKVVSFLSNDKLSLSAPNQPAFFTARRTVEAKSSGTRSDSCSLNGASITVVEAR